MLCIESVWGYERMTAAILWYNSLPNRITFINHGISFAVAVMDEQYLNLPKLPKLTESSENDFCDPEKKDWG